MNKACTFFALTLISAGVVGCNSGSKSSSIPANDSVADLTTPAPSAASAYQPAPQPIAQPVVYDTTPAPMMSTSGSTGGSIASGSYTVKKGDTLYGIARQRYGDGKQWSKIAAANPGLSPQTLKVGQTIQVP